VSERTEIDPYSAEGGAYRWALKMTGIALAVIAAVSVPVVAELRTADAIWSALAGIAVAAVSGMVTQGAMLIAHRREPTVFASIVAGAWLTKMAIIVVGILALSRVPGIDRPSFAGVAMVGILVTVGIDVWAVMKARVPYVIPRSKSKES
jgi:hypothetical protein